MKLWPAGSSRDGVECVPAENVSSHHQDSALFPVPRSSGETQRLYNQGQMRVPIDGIVGRVDPEQGAVVRAGEPLLETYGEQR
jgi:hypothetical protein